MKSYVTMEQHLCLVCAHPFDTSNILLDQKLDERFERYTLTGWGLCEEHEKLYEEGYIALVETTNEDPTLDTAIRTGKVVHIMKKAWGAIFDTPAPNGPMGFCQKGLIDKLEKQYGAVKTS